VFPGPIPTILDPGPPTEEAYAVLTAALESNGLALTEIRQIIISHGHAGHAGLAGRIAAETGATVLGHPLALEQLAGHADSAAARRTRLRRLLTAAGVPDDVVAQTLDSLVELPPVPEVSMRAITNASRPRILDRSWRVIATPGHTPDHLAFHDQTAGALFCGDILRRDIPTRHVLTGLRHDRATAGAGRLDELVQSLRYVGKLPVDVIWPGHGQAVRAPRVLVARRLAGLRQLVRRAREVVSGRDCTVWELALELEGVPPAPLEVCAMVGNAVALLEWLHAKGTLTREMRGGRVVYSLPAAVA
jgi:glyoxylase-like metal-dependent hydrolase (beta-lactamase superfamily II)